MKKVTQVPDFAHVKNEIYLESKKQLDARIESTFNQLSESDKKYLNVNFRILLIFLGFILLFIPWIVLYLKLEKIKKVFTDTLPMHEVYKAGFEKLKEVEFVKARHATSTRDLYLNRTAGIPSDARIDRSSVVVHMNINDKYVAVAQMGRATWRRQTGKNSYQTYHKNTGYIKIHAKGVMPKFNFTLNHRNKMGGKAHNLESTIFNKSFQFKSNDQIKARMIYTPLSMEETVKYKETNRLRYWKLYKESENITIIFQPATWQGLEINLRTGDLGSLEKIKDRIYNDISNDISNLYNIMFVVLIPPML